MPIDASIALGVKPMQVKSQGEYLNELYNQQNAEQSNQLNMMKMQAMNREIADSEAVKNYFATTNRDDPNFAQGLSAISPKLGMDYDEYTAKIATQKAAAAEHAEGTTGKKLSNLDAVRKFSSQSYKEIINRPSEAIVTAFIEDAEENPGIPKEILADMKQRAQRILSVPAPIDPDTGKPDYSLRQQYIMRMNLEAKDMLGKPGQRDIGGSVQDTMVDPITGIGTVTGTTQKTPTPGEQKPTFNQGAWHYPPTAQNPQGVTVGESRADKPKPLTAKQDTDLQHNIGKDRRTAIDAIASFGDVKLATQKVRKIPTSALENVAGYTGYLPSLSDASKNADTDIKNLKGKVTALGKIAASAGGAIGTMAVQEWTIIRDMIADLDEKATSPDKFLEQMDLIDAQLAGAEERLRESYATTHQEDFVRYPKRFELPAAGAGAAPLPASAAKRNPKDEADYQAYIKAHPTKAKAK
jgi:hypothetical protein